MTEGSGSELTYAPPKTAVRGVPRTRSAFRSSGPVRQIDGPSWRRLSGATQAKIDANSRTGGLFQLRTEGHPRPAAHTRFCGASTRRVTSVAGLFATRRAVRQRFGASFEEPPLSAGEGPPVIVDFRLAEEWIPRRASPFPPAPVGLCGPWPPPAWRARSCPADVRQISRATTSVVCRPFARLPELADVLLGPTRSWHRLVAALLREGPRAPRGSEALGRVAFRHGEDPPRPGPAAPR